MTAGLPPSFYPVSADLRDSLAPALEKKLGERISHAEKFNEDPAYWRGVILTVPWPVYVNLCAALGVTPGGLRAAEKESER